MKPSLKFLAVLRKMGLKIGGKVLSKSIIGVVI